MENLVYNYSQDIIANGVTKTFDTYECGRYNSLIVACITDQAGTMYVDFSIDGTNWDSTLTFTITATVNEVHRITVTRRFFRIRFTNSGGADQTYFRMQSIVGSHTTLTSPINLNVQSDADSLVTRPMDFNIMVASGLFQNHSNTIKDGITPSMSTGGVTQDLWSEAGAYTGFPTGSPEEGQIVVAGADTGTVWYSYLASNTSTDYVFASKAVAGAGSYDLGHNVYRCNFMYFVGSSATSFNVSKITLRHKVTTANVFVTIDANIGQSYCGAYTVPYGSKIYLDRLTGIIRGSASGASSGYLWYRPLNESPRLRFPFILNFGGLYFDDIDYLVSVPQQVDFIPRITNNSANSLVAQFTKRFIKVSS